MDGKFTDLPTLLFKPLAETSNLFFLRPMEKQKECIGGNINRNTKFSRIIPPIDNLSLSTSLIYFISCNLSLTFKQVHSEIQKGCNCDAN